MISISTGGREVLESASFISLGQGETKVVLGQAEDALTFVLDFSSVDGEEADIKIEPIDERSLRVKLINLNSPFSATFIEPINVGTFDNRQLSFMLSMTKIGKTGDFRQVTFTTYLGAEVSDGEI